MSHFSKITTQITNKETLVKALERLGLKPKVHSSPVKLVNTWGDNTGVAEVVICRKDLSYSGQEVCADLGFAKETDGTYSTVFDEYEFPNSILQEKFTTYNNFLAQLQANYEVESLYMSYPETKYNISEPVRANNGSYTFEITQKVDPYSLQVGAGNIGF